VQNTAIDTIGDQ